MPSIVGPCIYPIVGLVANWLDLNRHDSGVLFAAILSTLSHIVL